MIVLLAALEGEASGLRRRMALASESVAGLRDPSYTGEYLGKPVVLVVTGMGRQRAETGVDAVLAHFQVTTVISIGFSGALVRQLQVGDLVHLPGRPGPAAYSHGSSPDHAAAHGVGTDCNGVEDHHHADRETGHGPADRSRRRGHGELLGRAGGLGSGPSLPGDTGHLRCSGGAPASLSPDPGRGGQPKSASAGSPPDPETGQPGGTGKVGMECWPGSASADRGRCLHGGSTVDLTRWSVARGAIVSRPTGRMGTNYRA
jgi:hypothetical protein